MVKTDIHFVHVDALPLLLSHLYDCGFKVDSHRAVPFNDVRNIEALCPKNCVIIKSKYDV